MAWQSLLSKLSVARQQFDRQIALQCSEARQRRIGIFCATGCCNCCTLAVNCSFTEALAIADTLDDQQQLALQAAIPLLRQISLQAGSLKVFLQQFREKFAGCPWLHQQDGSCQIYQQRPFACRALISTRNSSWCGIDFSSLHPQEKEAFLSSLDPELVAFPSHYLAAAQELGLEFESAALTHLREAFGVALTGNLLYLTWLEQEYRLSEVIPNGLVATQDFLEKLQLNLPFLLQLQGET